VLRRNKNKVLAIVGIAAIVLGLGSMVVGGFAWSYTRSTAIEQGVEVNEDADFPFADEGQTLNDPFDMLGQANAIETHQLDRTGGQYYAEMPGKVPVLDEAGNPTVDENGEAVMAPNAERDSWIKATTLITALQLGAMAYGLITLVIFVGFTLTATGVVFLSLRD